jgi:hypothetical protein
VSSVKVVANTITDLNADADRIANQLPGYIVYVNAMKNMVQVEGSSESVMAAGINSARTKSHVDLRRSDRKVVRTADIYAGQILYFGADPVCTAGFSVLKASTRRIVTAAHCEGGLSRLGVALPVLASKNSGSHDEELLSTGTLTPRNRVLDGSRDTQTPNYRNITGKRTRANQALGSFFCRYGFATAGNYACGYLTANNVRGAMPSPAATSMLLQDVDTDLASPGDSGGPVFTGGTALGIMHACISLDPECDDPNRVDDLVYVAIDYVESGLGVTVLTTP